MHLHVGDLEFSPDRATQGFTVGAEVYISIGDNYFPQKHWYDMAWFDLKQWIPALTSFGKKYTDSCQLAFMDGPYSIRITRSANGVIHATCLYDHTPVFSQSEIDFTHFLRSVISCCRKYDRFLYENGKSNQFISEIRFLKSILDT